MGTALSDPDKGKQTDRNEKRKAVKPSESKFPAKKGKRDLFKNSEDTSKLQTVRVSRGYTDHYQDRGHSIRLTAALINIHEYLI